MDSFFLSASIIYYYGIENDSLTYLDLGRRNMGKFLILSRLFLLLYLLGLLLAYFLVMLALVL